MLAWSLHVAQVADKEIQANMAQFDHAGEMIPADGDKHLERFHYVHATGHKRTWSQEEKENFGGRCTFEKTAQLVEAKSFLEAMGPGPLHALLCLHCIACTAALCSQSRLASRCNPLWHLHCSAHSACSRRAQDRGGGTGRGDRRCTKRPSEDPPERSARQLC